jgi:hypothetical protein
LWVSVGWGVARCWGVGLGAGLRAKALPSGSEGWFCVAMDGEMHHDSEGIVLHHRPETKAGR